MKAEYEHVEHTAAQEAKSKETRACAGSDHFGQVLSPDEHSVHILKIDQGRMPAFASNLHT